MPAAIYAISYKDTGSILSYCQLAQQKLTDTASVNTLRDMIVGDTLSIALATPASTPTSTFKIPKTDLRVDEVQVPDGKLDQFTRNPTSFVLVLPDNDSTVPGDAKPKQVIVPTLPSPLTITMKAAGQVFTASLPSPPSIKTTVYAFFAGLDPVDATIEIAFTNATFPNVVTFTAGTLYPMVILARGYRTTVGLMAAS